MKRLDIQRGESWGIVGRNGSGKTRFAVELAEEWGAEVVSFEVEDALLERELREDDGEFLDMIDEGRTVREMLVEVSDEGLETVAEALGLSGLLDQGFLTMSTGERRRLMLARALILKPQRLVLDEPFDGLDQAFREPLRTLLDGMELVLVANRLSDLEGLVSHLACVEEGEVVYQGRYAEALELEVFQQFSALDHGEISKIILPERVRSVELPEQWVQMEKVTVVHGGREILSGLDWVVEQGENWKISGPNGCGKSTLVNLVTGDHPQCYSNEVTVMGMKRGSGESIWDVKSYVGIVSPSLHQQHRVGTTALGVVASGFFDSVGIYQEVPRELLKAAECWLDLVGMTAWKDKVFRSLSYGQQRLLLVARALVKQPPLLILDEPCQGLDGMNRALVLEVIDRIVERGLTQILYITHEPEDHLRCLTHELCYEAGSGFVRKELAVGNPVV